MFVDSLFLFQINKKENFQFETLDGLDEDSKSKLYSKHMAIG